MGQSLLIQVCATHATSAGTKQGVFRLSLPTLSYLHLLHLLCVPKGQGLPCNQGSTLCVPAPANQCYLEPPSPWHPPLYLCLLFLQS